MSDVSELEAAFAWLWLSPTTPSRGRAPTRSAECTGFFSLPAELRNNIYELLVVRESDCKERESKPLLNGGVRYGLSAKPGLRNVCRQLRREFTPYWCDKYQMVLEFNHHGPGFSARTRKMLATLNEQIFLHTRGFALDMLEASLKFRFEPSNAGWAPPCGCDGYQSKVVFVYAVGTSAHAQNTACVLLMEWLHKVVRGRKPPYLTKAEVLEFASFWD